MNNVQWNAFCEYRDRLKDLCGKWMNYSPVLKELQKAAGAKDTPDYPLETAVVYNTAYDEINREDEIKLIVIGDNPGKEEQLSANRRYLVGQSGRIAEGFFRRNPSLKIDFRKNVVIMNKTPVHTAKTSHLRYLIKNGGSEMEKLILESQIEMARMASKLHRKLVEGSSGDYEPELWLVGYSELKGKGLFLPYRDELKKSYGTSETWNKVFVYQHFSMNRFLIDLRNCMKENGNLSMKEALEKLGRQHRDEIFCSGSI